MSDYVRRAFRVQLNSTMESLLKTAVVEIARIFESSLCDHQVELAQKAEEISKLQYKLEKAERKLKKSSGENEEKRGNVKDETNGEANIVVANVEPSSGPCVVKNDDVQVPDWCAPLGCDDVVVTSSWTKHEDSVCPSVSLRPLSVSLWRMPAIKQEVEDEDFEPYLLTSLEDEPEKRPSPEERHRHLKRIEKMHLPLPGPVRRGPGRPPGKSKTRKMLRSVKREKSDVPVDMHCAKGNEDQPLVEKRKSAVNSRGRKRKIPVSGSGAEQVGRAPPRDSKHTGKTYSCKFCRKVFDTPFGRSVHVRSHKKCHGCRKMFPFPSSLRVHMQTCRKLKKLAMNSASNNFKSLCPTETKLSPSKDVETCHKEISTTKSPPNSNYRRSTSPTKDVTTSPKGKQYSCPECHKKFGYIFTLRDHIRLHTGEKPFACNKCPQKFRLKHEMKTHTKKVHKAEKKYEEANDDFASPAASEEPVNDQTKSSSENKDQTPDVGSKDVQECRRQNGKRKKIVWETMGKQGPEGFTCSVCGRVLTSKYSLIQHFRIHTGEKPFSCERCGQRFRCHPMISMHRKKCHGPLITCQKCGKNFQTQKKCTKHEVDVHKHRPYECQLCGKGFFCTGHLRNHYEKAHV